MDRSCTTPRQPSSYEAPKGNNSVSNMSIANHIGRRASHPHQRQRIGTAERKLRICPPASGKKARLQISPPVPRRCSGQRTTANGLKGKETGRLREERGGEGRGGEGSGAATLLPAPCFTPSSAGGSRPGERAAAHARAAPAGRGGAGSPTRSAARCPGSCRRSPANSRGAAAGSRG